jgi:AcrR family transcriptional regulator
LNPTHAICAGDSGVIDMELLSVIRRWHYRAHSSIREISRRTGLSRNTFRKYLRSDNVEPRFNAPDRPSKLDPFADKLSAMLRLEADRSRKQKRTIKQLHADLAALGYEGSYNRVAAFTRDWKAARQQEQQTSGRGTFIPLVFVAAEAFQFDWSEDWAIIAGERTKLQVAHVKLCYSRAFTLWPTCCKPTRCVSLRLEPPGVSKDVTVVR